MTHLSVNASEPSAEPPPSEDVAATKPPPIAATIAPSGRPRHRPSIQGSDVADQVYRATTLFFALCVPLLLLLIFLEVGRAGWPALRQFGIHFLTSSTWDPVNSDFGAAPAILGTIITSVIALV